MRQCGTNGRNGYRWTDKNDVMCGYQLTDGEEKKMRFYTLLLFVFQSVKWRVECEKNPEKTLAAAAPASTAVTRTIV